MKNLLSLIIILAFMSQGYGQTSFGFHVGATSSSLSNFNSDPIDGFTVEDKRPIGIMLGIVGQTMINESLSFVGELNFQQKGYRQKIIFGTDLLANELSRSVDNKLVFNSIEIPLLARMEFGEMTRFYVNAGPYVNFLIGGKIKSSGDSIDPLTAEVHHEESSGKIKFETEPENYSGDDYYVNGEINRFEIGAYIGGGASIPMGTGKLVLDARFGIGLTDYNDLNGADKPDGYKAVKANNITLSVGYMIEL